MNVPTLSDAELDALWRQATGKGDGPLCPQVRGIAQIDRVKYLHVQLAGEPVTYELVERSMKADQTGRLWRLVPDLQGNLVTQEGRFVPLDGLILPEDESLITLLYAC